MNDSLKALPSFTEIPYPISNINVQCFLWRIPATQKIGGLIRFIGSYRNGSAGADDATFIRSRVREFCDLSFDRRPAGLVVDLSELDYKWGDDLHVSSFTTERMVPTLVIIPQAQAAIFKNAILERDIRFDLLTACREIGDLVRMG